MAFASWRPVKCRTSTGTLLQFFWRRHMSSITGPRPYWMSTCVPNKSAPASIIKRETWLRRCYSWVTRRELASTAEHSMRIKSRMMTVNSLTCTLQWKERVKRRTGRRVNVSTVIIILLIKWSIRIRPSTKRLITKSKLKNTCKTYWKRTRKSLSQTCCGNK